MSRPWSWLAVALFAALIWILSSSLFSDEETSRLILPLLRWLLPQTSTAAIETLHTLIRKVAHVAEYFLFGLLLFRAVRGPQRGWRLRWAIIALLIAAGYSGLDELRQTFEPTRGALVWDSVLDTAGAALAQLATWLGMKREGNLAPRPT